MKRRAAFLALALSLLAAQPCSAQMASLALGANRLAASATNALTTSGSACPVGSLIVVGSGYLTIADTLSSVTDSAGNTYQTPIDNVTTTGLGTGIAYAKNTTANLPIGGTITATFGGVTTNAIAALCISNADPVSPLDTHNHTATGTASTSATNVTTGTLANATSVVMGLITTLTASAAVTCNGAYTKLSTITGSSPAITLCAQTVSATTSLGWAPSWVNSATYMSNVVSFQGVSVKSAAMTMTGVGP